MKTIILNEPGSVDNLLYTESAKPSITANEVLVKTISLSVNVIDYKVRSNEGALNWILGSERPAVIGWDLSGTVVEVGDEVTDFKIGDDVFGMANFPGKGSAYAEFVAVPSAHLTLKPENISHQEAASATLAALTAWQALVEKANVKKGDKVLIHAASGGVGHYATQIAKHLGAYVIGTSSAKNREFVLQNGADQHIDYTTEKFQEIVSDVDFVLDTVGGDTILKSLEVIKEGGTIITITTSSLSDEILEKAKSKEVNLSFLLVQSSGENMLQLAQLLENGIVKSHVSKTFSFDQMGEAHLYLETGRTVGKIVVNL
ncbi:NADP-dependent oxidoreductase [Flavobacterium pectinovorum]|uniref:NADP-dependent oxidoreductase n=1 Tax=Flavobacterium pectinovorum TaxID=29533 RepID=UPI001FAB7E34|nr:NADP-dependent oxidoreductase [Flavobacterium pectinovorum]MCI9845780.1 NADP-dependent oxidoreductase [Flavobacterium pectinovorum]